MTETSKSTTIRALDRGLILIELLAKNGTMTLAEVRHASGLANPTLLRVLATLQNRGWVRRNIAEGHYELSHSLGALLGETAHAHPLAEFAAPVLLDLKGRRDGLPSDLCAIIAPGRIEVVESTRIKGPMAPTRTSFGIRPSMVLSAHGRAILAFSTPDQRAAHIAGIRATGTRQDLHRVEDGRLDVEIGKTRKRGFGTREPDYWQPPFDFGPALGAMAVPILAKGGLHGTLSLLWMDDENTLEDMLARGALGDMQTAAMRIAKALDAAGVKAPVFSP